LEGICKRCLHTPGLDIDLRWLDESTPLGEIYEIFKRVSTVSPISKYGYSLTSLGTYLQYIETIPCNIEELFDVLGRLLVDKNNRFIKETNA
jgi:hypothetical protein